MFQIRVDWKNLLKKLEIYVMVEYFCTYLETFGYVKNYFKEF